MHRKRRSKQERLVRVSHHQHRRPVAVDEPIAIKQHMSVRGALEQNAELLLCRVGVWDVTRYSHEALGLSVHPPNRGNENIPPFYSPREIRRCAPKATD